MTTTSLPVDQLITVRSTIAPAAAVQRDFGRTLLITTDDDLPGGTGRTRIFPRLSQVDDVFLTTSQPYRAAATYFSQSPYPRPLVIGRWADTASGARLRGGAPGTLAQLQAITAGAMDIGGLSLTAVDLSAAGSLAAVATAVQTAIQTASGAIVAWVAATTYTAGDVVEGSDNDFYTALSATTGDDPTTDGGANWTLNGPNLDAATVTYDAIRQRFDLDAAGNTALTALPTGTLATPLGWTAAAGATNEAGYDADTDIADAFGAILENDSSWYWVAADAGIADDDDLETLARTVQASGYLCQHSADTIGADVLTPNETTSLAAILSALELDSVTALWSRTRDNKALSFAGRMSSVDFYGAQTLINPKGKQLPGTTPDNLDLTGHTELARKRINYYTPFWRHRHLLRGVDAGQRHLGGRAVLPGLAH